MFKDHYSNFNHYISIRNIKESIKNKKPKKFKQTKGITVIREEYIKEITGLNIEQFNILVDELRKLNFLTKQNNYKYSLEDQLIITSYYMRSNQTFRSIDAFSNVNKSTICRIIRKLSPYIGKINIDDNSNRSNNKDKYYIVDGSLIPCSDKRYAEYARNKKNSANIQILIDKDTKIILKTSVDKGNVHDSTSFKKNIKEYLEENNIELSKVMGDKGYVGNNIITLIKKPTNKTGIKCNDCKTCTKCILAEKIELTEGKKLRNKLFSKERVFIEHTIAHIKSYKVLRHSRLRKTDLKDVCNSISIFHNVRKLVGDVYERVSIV